MGTCAGSTVYSLILFSSPDSYVCQVEWDRLMNEAKQKGQQLVGHHYKEKCEAKGVSVCKTKYFYA